ncbi:hypothetical protein [uncultured Ruminococcus sp.]|uniref:hypothetical protein n=1 Tax=uncultured Ruminococcus sp. TaxID=165186 RepID=UPI00266EA1ED|nr:hypothetical protein [uncultured Ruminococcus sp.]
MTATKVAQQLIHAALDVVAPLERFSYLSGVLDGYKLAKDEIDRQQFQVQNKDDVQEYSRV